MFREIRKCRICGNEDLVPVIHLGIQELTGIFPNRIDQEISKGPLELVRCNVENSKSACGLLQLRHSYNLSELYGENYGYRSGLNQSMVMHLNDIVRIIKKFVNLSAGDLVIDIGSNDCTLLNIYHQPELNLVGIDPTGEKFKKFYPDCVTLIPEFFSSDLIKNKFGTKKAKVISSIAMFYDLEDPMEFVREIYESLSENGIWIFEQSYMPRMLEVTAYDTICHEHLEYYSLEQIKWMTDRLGFKIIHVEETKTNGGSFLIVAAKNEAAFPEAIASISRLLEHEKQMGLATPRPYEDFREKVFLHREQLVDLLKRLKRSGKKVLGYGASTKGNVILQFCDISTNEIPFIAEINYDKFGCFTPGTHIPIISEAKAHAMNPDYLLALPWHFQENFLEREKAYLERGGAIIFPLPEIKVISEI